MSELIDYLKISNKDKRNLKLVQDKKQNILLSKNIKIGENSNFSNFLFIGHAGGGILSSVFFSNLIETNTSCLVLDRDKYLYDLTAEYLEEKGFKVELLDFENPKESYCLDVTQDLESAEDFNIFMENIYGQNFPFRLGPYHGNLLSFVGRYLKKYRPNYNLLDFYEIINKENFEHIFKDISNNEFKLELDELIKEWGKPNFKKAIEDCQKFFYNNDELIDLSIENSNAPKVYFESLFFEKKIIFIEFDFRYKNYINYFIGRVLNRIHSYSLFNRNLLSSDNYKVNIYIPEFGDYRGIKDLDRFLILKNLYLRYILSINSINELNHPLYRVKLPDFFNCFDAIILHKRSEDFKTILDYYDRKSFSMQDITTSCYLNFSALNQDSSIVILGGLPYNIDKYIYVDEAINCFKDKFYKNIIFSKKHGFE